MKVYRAGAGCEGALGSIRSPPAARRERDEGGTRARSIRWVVHSDGTRVGQSITFDLGFAAKKLDIIICPLDMPLVFGLGGMVRCSGLGYQI